MRRLCPGCRMLDGEHDFGPTCTLVVEEEDMPVESYAQFHVNENDRVAREAHAMLMKGEVNELYLWFEPKRLIVATDKPSDKAQLAFGERVPTHLTVDQLVYWFAQRTARVPYLVDG